MEICKSFLKLRSFHTSSSYFKKVMPSNLKGRSTSSQIWLTRQLKDPYVEKARLENYRCRSAFKLIEMNSRFKILSPGITVVDCGAAPGSWTQVAVKAINSNRQMQEQAVGKVVAIDQCPIHAIEGATILGNLDFTSKVAQDRLFETLDGKKVDVVLSDMAPKATGIRDIDHELIVNLAYAALKFSIQVLKVEGTFVTKLWDGGKSLEFEKNVARFYKSIKIVRPAATRDESTEIFILARGFKGLKS